MKFKKGDVVKVWSLQSFFHGGFLEGVTGVVSQDQIGSSVMVSVKRNFDGVVKVDPHYEVYAKQLEIVKRPDNKATLKQFEEWLSDLCA